jgi:hypothetical protein
VKFEYIMWSVLGEPVDGWRECVGTVGSAV